MTPAPQLPSRRRPALAARARSLAVAAVAALALAAPAAQAAAAVSDRVLVRIDPSASPAERAAVGRALGANGSESLVAGWRAYQLGAPVSAREARADLAATDADEAMQLDLIVRPAEALEDPYLADGLQWGLDNATWAGGVAGADIEARRGWSSLAALAPTVVAVIDTGVDIAHPDLVDRVWTNPAEIAGNGIDDDGNGRVDDVAGWDFANDDASVFDSADGEQHGTHVAGTIGARRFNAIGVAGVADNARIMPLKFLGPNGGYTSDGIRAIDYAVAHGARVINASWGGGSYSPALCDAIASATNAGVLVVIAAGNDAADRDSVASWPANCPAADTLVVAATDASDALSSFSAFGAATVDLAAPGSSILSTVPGGYAYMSGTSMATPHVAGVAAALLGERPELGPAELKAAILGGGDPLAALAGRTASGRRLNLPGALGADASASGPSSPAPPPSAGTTLPAPSPAVAPAPAPVVAPAPAPPRADAPPAARVAPPASARLVGGRKRPAVRLVVRQQGRLTVTVRRGSARGRVVGRLALNVRPGLRTVALPRAIALRMARPGPYRVTLAAAGLGIGGR